MHRRTRTSWCQHAATAASRCGTSLLLHGPTPSAASRSTHGRWGCPPASMHVRCSADPPSLRYEQHAWAQVYCLSWNMVRRNVFLSGSWDDTIKLWDLAHPASLATFKEHTYCVYAANWCALLPMVAL